MNDRRGDYVPDELCALIRAIPMRWCREHLMADSPGGAVVDSCCCPSYHGGTCPNAALTREQAALYRAVMSDA